jgi:hypothetical protein
VLEQRIARAHRHGQKSSVQVINLIAKDTIEERMLDTLAAKKNVFAAIFGAEDSPTEIKFADTGQSLLKKLDELLLPPAAVELELAPAAVSDTGFIPEVAPAVPAGLKGFAALLVDRLPGKIQIVRKTPAMPGVTGDGVIVVVTGSAAELRFAVEAILHEHYIESAPQLHLMDSEGYKALSSFLPALAAVPGVDELAYHAAGLRAASAGDAALLESRRKRAAEGLAFARKRLALANVLLQGGFPEEMARPLREALAWGLTSLLALHTDRDPAADLPPARLIQAELVEQGHLPAEVAARVAQARDLTALPEAGEEIVPLSAQTGQTLLEIVQELVTLVDEQTVKVG